ncbi:MAG: WD40/YVTN/BNR-like repeat-containing protein [Terriglobales bacterium]
MPRRLLPAILVLCTLGAAAALCPAQQFNPNLLQAMRWRLIGPFRGGRTVAVSGVPTQPGVFYFGAVNGGVWKSTDYGNTWKPIFDHEPTGSIGALAVAASNPEIVYVGSGEGLRRPDLSTGDGMYKSTDGGQTWTHLGLRQGQQIGSIIVDPHDPDRLFVAVLGHPYGPNAQRGVFRSLDGGRTFQKVLYRDENTGAVQVAFDPQNPQIVYAVMWASRYTPWAMFEGAGSGLYKSTDGGTTWHRLTQGLPAWQADHLGRIGIGIAPSDPSRIYALVEARQQGGVYRSDDSGASWHRINTNTRLWGRGSDFACIRVDPTDDNMVYIANTSTYRSSDGGQNFLPLKGAPGGDDYHTVWIDPSNRNIVMLGVDQGATISVNRGRTWSSWYNQPTGEMYKVSTDNQFPYNVYGGQQESGSVGISSRGPDGEITLRNWHPAGAFEYADVVADPLHQNLIYGAGGGAVTRYNKRTHVDQNVGPQLLTRKYRFRRTMPIAFSPADPHALYLGGNVVFRTTDGGQHWDIISPDLTRHRPVSVPTLGPFASGNRNAKPAGGVVYALSPSPLDANLLWAGTDDGLIWVTHDGGAHWTNVTPPQLKPWWKVSTLDASHFDPNTVYAAVNTIRLDQMQPHIFRTHDGGKTWTEIDNGLPDGAATDVVREDPVRRGLLYAGTETSVYVSFNDGDQWQSLQMNLPHTSMRDMVVHQNDLVVGTHGRAFWILDDVTPLRQLTARVASAPGYLFKPEVAYRLQRNTNTDTPLIPETPAGTNPPTGAILDYALGSAATGPVALAIYDAQAGLVHRFSSSDISPVTMAELARTIRVPLYWVAPFKKPGTRAGLHRFVWHLRYTAPQSLAHSYPISAIDHRTPRQPQGVLVVPGQYTVKLTVGGETYSQPLTVKMDPRLHITPAELQQQFEVAQGIALAMNQSYAAYERARTSNPTLARKLARLNTQLNGLLGGSAEIGGVDNVPAAPTPVQVAAAKALESQVQALLKQ